jgi:hypothetical protein
VAQLGEPGDLEDAPDGSAVRCHARWEGFDLVASHVVPAGARARLELVCRYVLRPPLVSERLDRSADVPAPQPARSPPLNLVFVDN